MKKVFTTGQVARMCKVASRTVSKWVDSGKLAGYRVPLSKDRRIPRDNLARFLNEQGMPLGILDEEGWHNVLIIGADKPLIDRIREALPEREDYRCEPAASAFEAGVRAERFRHDAVVIDLAMGRSEALQIARSLRRSALYEKALILGLAGEDEPSPRLLSGYGFSEAFKKPVDVALLAERIRGGCRPCPG